MSLASLYYCHVVKRRLFDRDRNWSVDHEDLAEEVEQEDTPKRR